jgi:hypothetical protein
MAILPASSWSSQPNSRELLFVNEIEAREGEPWGRFCGRTPFVVALNYEEWLATSIAAEREAVPPSKQRRIVASILHDAMRNGRLSVVEAAAEAGRMGCPDPQSAQSLHDWTPASFAPREEILRRADGDDQPAARQSSGSESFSELSHDAQRYRAPAGLTSPHLIEAEPDRRIEAAEPFEKSEASLKESHSGTQRSSAANRNRYEQEIVEAAMQFPDAPERREEWLEIGMREFRMSRRQAINSWGAAMDAARNKQPKTKWGTSGAGKLPARSRKIESAQ